MNDVLYPAFGVLLVDDEAPWLRTLSMTLEGPGGITNLDTCRDSREVMDRLASRDFGLVLLDLTMPHISGETLLGKIVEEHPGIAVIVVSGLNQVDTAVRCMRAGAFDYFVKGVDDDRLLDGVRRALRLVQLERENRDMSRRFLAGRLEHSEAFASIVTADPGMRAIFRYVESVASSAQPILLTGESGTGKELVARALHQLGRPQGPLVSLNVAGLDDNVFADTLFGHVRGAFTGADAPRRGMVEQAAGGTLFFDEIGDLSPSSQVKLLRLLQEGEYYPLGSDEPKQSLARIVVATHQDLAARQTAGGFRKDLYYRLRAHHLHLPSLRERKGDIPLLLRHFIDEAARELGKTPPTLFCGEALCANIGISLILAQRETEVAVTSRCGDLFALGEHLVRGEGAFPPLTPHLVKISISHEFSSPVASSRIQEHVKTDPGGLISLQPPCVEAWLHT